MGIDFCLWVGRMEWFAHGLEEFDFLVEESKNS
jgi:hypothetical protein